MNSDENEIHKKLTFNEKLALFDKINIKSNVNSKKRNSKEEEKILNNIEKKIQLYQPKKTPENSFQKNDIKKRENNYILKEKNNDTNYSKKANKTNLSNIEYSNLAKHDNNHSNHKNNYNKTSSSRKISDIKVYPNTNNINNNVSAKIKIFNENEEKNKLNYSNNPKGTIKSIEKVNEFNPNDKNNILIPPLKKIKIFNNKNTSQKEILKISNRSPKSNSNNKKVFENVLLFSQKQDQNKINNDINKKNKRNIKEKIAFFNNDIKNTQLNKSQEIKEEKNNKNLNNKELKNKENNKRKYSDSNNTNKNILQKQNKKETMENFQNKKPINLSNKENKNIHVQQNKLNSPKEKETKNYNLNNNKKFSKQINTSNLITNNKKNIQNSNLPQKERPEVKKRTSKSFPKKNENKLGNNNNDEKKFVFLDSIKIKQDTKINSFCKAFFITSFPKHNIQIIKNSEETIADCGHGECSLLPAFEPEIIYKYPEKDEKDLELNNISASICFPNSIKVCYCEEEEKIYALKNHRSCFTNQTGDRFYAMMYHFYVRMNNKDFYKNYDKSLLESITMKYSDEIGENLEKKISLINNINGKKYVYIPYCLCLISKYPYFPQLDKCLQSIMISIKFSKSFREVNEIINYLIKSVPSPYINTSIYFPIPYYNRLLELNPTIYQEISLYGNNSIILLNKLTINNLILLFRLLLFEQKILLISSEYDNLVQVSLSLISLLYPLSWIHIYLPIITSNMLKYLQSFLPFFSGMNKLLFDTKNVQNLLGTSQKDLFIFDIDKNTFEISNNLLGKKKVNSIKYLNNIVPSFPKQIEDIIIEQLNVVKSYCQKTQINNSNFISVNIKMKLIFIQAFIEIFHDYKKYLTIIDDLPVFNTNAFLTDKPETDKKFYKEVTSTQLYQVFIQNSLHYSNTKDNKYYFDELIEKYLYEKEQNLKSKYYIILHDKFRSSMKQNLFTSKKCYIIKPSPKLKLFSKLKPCENLGKENKNQNKNKITLVDEINLYLKEELKDDKNCMNENEIIEENKRIIYTDINISNKNDIKELIYFITPEEKQENEEKNVKNDDNQSIKINNLETTNTNNDENENLTDIEKEDIRDNIRGTLTRVFKSEKVNFKKDTEILLESLKKDYGKKYFVDIISGNRNTKQVKIISDESFTILLEVISKFLLKLTQENKKNYLYAIKLIKSCAYFKTIVNKIQYLLNEKIYEKITKDYPLYKNIEFWDIWLEEELNGNDLKILNKLRIINEEKDDNYYYIDEDSEEFIKFKDNYKNEIKETLKTMGIMKLPKSIKLSMIDHCNIYLMDTDFKKEQVLEIMK